MTDRAKINVSPETMYLDPANTNRLLELTGNLSESESYTIAAKDLSWFAIVDFNDMGYVKDDEKIDPDALLKSLRENQEAANSQRIEQKLSPLLIRGWSVVPHYDRASHNLEFGTVLSSDGSENVNYTVRMLGRRGVMNATLVTSPETLQHDLGAFRVAMAGFAFKPDESYAAYTDGDKVAEYGLAALVTGGAAAAVVKAGAAKGIFAVLAAFWKVIAVGAIAAFAAFRGFLARLFGRGKDLGPPPGDIT
ncbi:MAG: DUF2167 domain-containing protein [Pseudomonadota bacterium]